MPDVERVERFVAVARVKRPAGYQRADPATALDQVLFDEDGCDGCADLLIISGEPTSSVYFLVGCDEEWCYFAPKGIA